MSDEKRLQTIRDDKQRPEDIRFIAGVLLKILEQLKQERES